MHSNWSTHFDRQLSSTSVRPKTMFVSALFPLSSTADQSLPRPPQSLNYTAAGYRTCIRIEQQASGQKTAVLKIAI